MFVAQDTWDASWDERVCNEIMNQFQRLFFSKFVVSRLTARFATPV